MEVKNFDLQSVCAGNLCWGCTSSGSSGAARPRSRTTANYGEALRALRGFIEPFRQVLNPLLVGLVGTAALERRERLQGREARRVRAGAHLLQRRHGGAELPRPHADRLRAVAGLRHGLPIPHVSWGKGGGLHRHKASAFSAPLRETKDDWLDNNEQALPNNWNLWSAIFRLDKTIVDLI